jgi:hypothetical protein
MRQLGNIEDPCLAHLSASRAMWCEVYELTGKDDLRLAVTSELAPAGVWLQVDVDAAAVVPSPLPGTGRERKLPPTNTAG